MSNHTLGFSPQDSTSSELFRANQSHCRVYGVIRETTERLSRRNGWKRHVPWVVSSLGAALNVSQSYIYKNYPDKDEVLTAVRLARWSNPVVRVDGGLSEPRVSRYEGEYFEYLREELSERRSVLSTAKNPLPPLRAYIQGNSVDRVVTVPIFAGEEWWGFIGVEDSVMSTGTTAESVPIGAVNDILRTIATVIGESIRGAGLDQALRWSEQLQRAQRDIALTVTRGGDRRHALTELLKLICELGDFDSGAFDIAAGDLVRIAEVGETPQGGPDAWCKSCRPAHSVSSRSLQPLYGDATMLEFCESGCPVHSSGFHSYAVLPIVYEGRWAGSLSLFSSRRTVVPGAVRRSIEAIGSEIGMIMSTVSAEEARLGGIGS